MRVGCRRLAVFLFACAGVLAQTATLHGRLADESGAVVPGGKVLLHGPGGVLKSAAAQAQGTYSIGNLLPGEYTVDASAPQLALGVPQHVTLHAGPNTLDLQLKIATMTQQVTVQSDAAPALGVDAASNASATVLSGSDLDSLSDDPQDLADDLAALAGPSAGPSGGSIYIDGFSAGQLPPKESIREIRINSNPFSPEYDKLGLGRVEIFTKPGSDKFHASIGYNLGTDIWNTRNPYAEQKTPFLLQETENSFSGPLSKRASFTLDVERQAVDNGSVTNAIILNSETLTPEQFSSVLVTPQRHLLVGPHVDYQLNENNTLSLRYLWTHADVRDAGIGSFDLISRGYHLQHNFNTVQIAETSVHGNLVNEIRFQYYRHGIQTDANTTMAPEIQVLGSFNGGGASTNHGLDLQNTFEFQNYTTVVRGPHTWRFGVRARGQLEDSVSALDFNGTFTFTGGLAPELDNNNQPVLTAGGQPVVIQISSIEQYRRTLLFQRMHDSPAEVRALGGGASQFTRNAGRPELNVGQADTSVFAGDDWRVRPNLTVNLGLRYETQTNIRDHADFAPRVAFAWAPHTGKGGRMTVLRGGFGMFYDRFALTNILLAGRYNGVQQQQYVVTNPDFFPSVPAIASLTQSATGQSIQEVDSGLRAPYLMQSAVTLERQLPKKTTLAVTYTNSHAVHVLRTEDINAPMGNGVLPYPNQGPIFLMTSSGLYNQNQMIVNVNSKINPAVSLFSYYVLNRALSNSDGLATVPANPYNFSGEYGPAATDVRHRVVLGGSIFTRWNLRFNPFITVQSGAPFNITSGEDFYGTTVFTARPAFATDPSKPGLVQTRYGLLDPNPGPGERLLSRNYGRGPGQYQVNLRIGRMWGFGPERGGGTARSARDTQPSAGPALSAPQNAHGLFVNPNTSHRYNLNVSMSARNILNHTNPGPIIGNISSPLFGRANQVAGSLNGEGFSELANNRRLELQIRFTF